MNLTARGWVCLVGGLFIALVAAVIGQADLTPPGLFLAGLPLLSLLALLPARLRLRTTRWLPDAPVQVGEGVDWRVGVEVGGFNPGGTGDVAETLAPALGSVAHVTFEAGMRSRVAMTEIRAVAAWRGRHTVGPTTVTLTQPLRLARVRRTFRTTGEVVATPRVSPIAPGRGWAASDGGAQSPLARAGVTGIDDAMIREYQAGDDVRRVHWRSTARLGALMVRREESTWDPKACLVLDTRPGSWGTERPDDRFEAAVCLIASFASHLVRHGFSVSLADTSGWFRRLNADAVLAEPEALLALAEIDPAGDATITLDEQVTRPSDIVLAVFGQLTQDDAAALTGGTRTGGTRDVLVLTDGPGPAPDPSVVDFLAELGWAGIPVPADVTADAAWRACAQEAVR